MANETGDEQSGGADDFLTKAEMKKLFAEWKADYAARRAENAQPRDHLSEGKGVPPLPQNQDKQQGRRHGDDDGGPQPVGESVSHDGPPAARYDPSSPRRVDYRGADLPGQQFVDMNLDYYDFRGANLRDANFTGSDLRYTDFRGAEIHRANFQHTSLYGAKMQGAEAFGADFRHAKLQLANLQGAYTEGALFNTQSPGDLVAGGGMQEKSWKQRELDSNRMTGQDGNADNDQNGQGRQRSLPAEQRQQKRKQGPGR